jgi:hypothetical protein
MNKKFTFPMVVIVFILNLNHCTKFQESDFDSNSTLSNLLLFNRFSQGNTLTINPEPGHYTTSQVITMSAHSAAKIYFTTDGTEPTVNSNLYKEPIHIWKLAGVKLRAVAIKNDYKLASVNQENYYSYLDPKTGQTGCWDQAGGSIACSNSGLDGEYQKGITRTYTGPTQHGTYPNDYTTTDEATGIIWKSCSQGQTGANCSGVALPYDWTTAQTGVGGCNELNTMNTGSGYAGRTDWRLPSVVELRTILDFSGTNLPNTVPRINANVFPNTPANAGNIGTFWTDSDTTLNPFIVNFTDGSGTFNALNKSTTLNVRCVAGFPSARRYELSDNGNSTIKDHRTGLSWMKCSDGLSGNACATGIASMVVWGTAVANCNNMAIANKKWRLPSVNEMAGFFNLINPTLPSASPRVDLSYYPNTTGGLAYWASTTGTGIALNNKLTITTIGNAAEQPGINGAAVRCVSED